MYAFGNAGGPRAPRAGDFDTQANDTLIVPSDPPKGASLFSDPANDIPINVGNTCHMLPAGTEIPVSAGAGLIPDGVEFGYGPLPDTHQTMYTSTLQELETFQDRYVGLDWAKKQKVTKSRSIREACELP